MDPIFEAIASTRRRLNPTEALAPVLNTRTPTMNTQPETPKAERPAIAKGAYKNKAAASRSIPDKDLPPAQRLHKKADDVPARSKVKAIKSTVVVDERKPDLGRAKRAEYFDAEAVSPKDIAKHMKLTPKAVRTLLRRVESKIPAALRVKGPRWGFANIDSITAFLREHMDA